MKKNRRSRYGIILLIFFILFALRTFVFTRGNAGFYRSSCAKEFSDAAITGILQDPKDFIWIATYNGLYRYDGYECTIYKPDPTKPGTISGTGVTCLCLDSEGTLWVGTYDNGLNRFDREAETFTHYRGDENDYQSLGHDSVSVIYEDQKEYLWIGTLKGGLNRLDKRTGEFKRFQHEQGNLHSLGNNNVTSICRDSRGVLWIGTEDGLYRFIRGKEIFSRYTLPPGGGEVLKNNHIQVVYEDRKGNLWIGTRDGLFLYREEKDRFDPCSFKTKPLAGTTGHNIKISSLYEDRNGTLWVGTYGDGLYQVDKEKRTLTPFPPGAGFPPSLGSKLITGIYEDKSGLLWIGTEDGGVSIYDRGKEKFSHFIHNPLDDNSLCDDMVFALQVVRDKAGEGEILWVGTHSGLTRFDRKKNRFTHFKHNPGDPQSISSNVIRDIFIDSHNLWWIATGGGLNRLDPKTGKFTAFQNQPGNPGSISNNDVVSIQEDQMGGLWIGTAGGLNRLNREENSFTRCVKEKGNPRTISDNNILCMSKQFIDGGTVLWIGTYRGGLNKFMVEEGKFYHYNTAAPAGRGKLSSDIIRSIYPDKKNILWLGTDGGLNRLDTNTEEVIVYTDEKGLCNNQVYGILEDEYGHLWLSTDNGLSRFDKTTGEFKTFNEGNGVPIRRFNLGAYYQSQSGEMFFGGVNGFISFFPGEVRTNSYVPAIVITDFKIFNQPAGIGKGKFLEKSITETDEIRLSYQENMFSFEFSALDFTWPGNNRYKYKMEDFDQEWIQTDAQNRLAQYTNLDHGEYTFKVTGSNNDGVWNETGISLKITITPPYWKTWWFRIVLGLSFVLFLLLFYLQRTWRLRKKLAEHQRLQKILKQSHDEMEQARDLAEFRRAEIEKLISAISSLLIAVDSRGKIFQSNETAEKFFNLPASQTGGRSFVDVLKDYISPGMLNMIIEKGLGKDNSYENFEIPVQSQNGRAKLLLGIINPLLDRGGQKLGFLLLAEDITHRKEEEMRRNLAQKMESLGKMMRNIAHEIKSPLQYIGNNSSFIHDAFENLVKFVDTLTQTLTNLEKSDPIKVKEEIEKIVREYDIGYILEEGPNASDQIARGVSRVSSIIQSMLNYTNPAGSAPEHVDIRELIENTLILIRSKKKDLFEIETEFCRDIPRVPGYPGELMQVFMNLLINAADSVQEKGQPGLIKITTTCDEKEVIISIADNGRGIPDEVKDSIYNPFFTTKEVGKGTGNGLSLAYNIVTQKHKGKIDFESQAGEGTTFYVHLPVSPGETGDND